MPKIVDKDAMRLHIIKAAMQTYNKYGFHAAKMSDIAKAAGVAKGTLYLYFKSKEALTTGLVKWIFQQIEQEIAPMGAARTLPDYIEQIRGALDTSREARIETRMFFEVLGPSFGSGAVAAEVAGFFERVGLHNARQLEQLITAGEVAQDVDAQAMGRSIASLIDGMVTHRALFGPDDTRYNAMTDATLMLFQRGLQP